MVDVALTPGCLCPPGLILFIAAGVDIVVVYLDGGDERQRIVQERLKESSTALT